MASLEDDVVRLSKTGNSADEKRPIALPGQDQTHSDEEDDEDARNLDLSRFVTDDAAYYDDDVNNDDDLVDLGIAMGRMRITERIGGLVRPRFAEEVSTLPLTYLIYLTSIIVVDSNTPSATVERSSRTRICSGARSPDLARTEPRLCCSFLKLSIWTRYRKDICDGIYACEIHSG